MKKIITVLSIVSFNLFGACLEVGTVMGQSCTGDSVRVDAISNIAFSTKMKVSDNNLNVLEIPLYVFSDDPSSPVSMTIHDVFALTKGNDSIATKFEYIQNNIVVATIVNGTAFSLLVANASGRDGNSEVGRIRISINAELSDTQTAGTYVLSKRMSVKLRNGNSSGTQVLSVNGIVEQVSMVGFENLSSYTIGEAFKNGTVDYGDFNLNSTNEQIKELFVKNNTTGNFKIKFATSDLISQVDANYKIAMRYYYAKLNSSEQGINNDEFFTLMSGKNNGSKVGQIRFVTEALTGSLIAGEYKAVINVTVQAQ